MKNNELKELLTQLDTDIDKELTDFFNNNQILKSKFSKLVNISILEDASFDEDVIDKLDLITDNMDSFNFGSAKEDINELLKIL